MATLITFDILHEDIAEKIHNFASDTLRTGVASRNATTASEDPGTFSPSPDFASTSTP